MKFRASSSVVVTLLDIGFLSSAAAHDFKGATKELESFTPQIEAAKAQLSAADEQTRSVLNNLRLWPIPKKLTVCFIPGSSPAVRKRVTESMKRVWPLRNLTQGRLEFDADTFANPKDCSANPSEDIRIDFKAKDGYWSYVGIESTRHTPSMNLQGFTEKTPDDGELDRLVGHETGHALGLEHEHQSPAAPDCGWNFKYILTHYEWKSEADMHYNFDKLKDFLSNNRHAYIFSTYDRTSLMHYDFEKEAFDKGESSPCFITQNLMPSNQDQAAIRTAYGPDLAQQQGLTRDIDPLMKQKLSEETYNGISPLLRAKIALLPK